MIKLSRIVEQAGMEGQYYDLGRDFANFRRAVEGVSEQVKQKFEQSIGSQLNGKRVRARASRGYKQYVKDYEFDVSRVTLDDYYDNYVVVAHDTSTPKPKEYFLKPGFKIQILGPATGPAPHSQGAPPMSPAPRPISPKQEPDAAQSQPMALAPAGNTPVEAPMVKESEGIYDAYPIEEVTKDVQKWLPSLLKKPETAMRDFVKGLGWKKALDERTSVALFDVKVPAGFFSRKIDERAMGKILELVNKKGDKSEAFKLVKMERNPKNDDWTIRVRKTITGKK